MNARTRPADLDRFYRTCARPLRLRLRSLLGGRMSDELLDDACANAWTVAAGRPDVLAHWNAYPWLLKVAYHEAMRLHRLERRAGHLDAIPEEERRAIEARDAVDLHGQLEAREALGMVAALRPCRRRVFERHIAGLSYQEVMAEQGLTYTNVNRQIAEARAELRELVA